MFLANRLALMFVVCFEGGACWACPQSYALLHGWIEVGWSLRFEILSSFTRAARHNAAVVHRIISAGASGSCRTAICSV